MSTIERTSPAVQGGMPTWSDKDQFFKTRRWFRILATVVILLWLVLIGWVLVTPIEDAQAMPLAVGANLTLVLAPVLAAAAAVERRDRSAAGPPAPGRSDRQIQRRIAKHPAWRIIL